jgi:DNA segregation ATPase FtsK/SpoIIIE, S-DNA-T family
MTLENEYRQKSEQAAEDKAKKETKGKPAKERKPSDNALMDRLSNRFDKKRVTTILGIAMVLFSFFTFLSCFSYFFTWTSDQDRVLDVSLFGFLFDNNPEPVENWLGKFGAWILIGFKWMLNILLLPIRRSIAVAVLFMVWSSVFLGYFVEHIDYLGGTFGFVINQWLKLTIGSFGSFIAIVALLWIVLVILFNADIMSWWNRAKGAKESFFEDDQPLAANMTDIHVVNTIRKLYRDSARGRKRTGIRTRGTANN